MPYSFHSRCRRVPRTLRTGRGEGLRVLAVTCGEAKEEAVAPAGSAGGRIGPERRPQGGFDGRIGQASHRRNPRSLCGSAPACSRDRGGNGPVAGRLADQGRMPEIGLAPFPAPGRSRIANARPGPCRTMPPAVSSRPCPGGETRHVTACRMRTPSGEFRAARNLRHPRMTSFPTRHAPYHFPNGTACARPSGPDLALSRRHRRPGTFGMCTIGRLTASRAIRACIGLIACVTCAAIESLDWSQP